MREHELASKIDWTEHFSILYAKYRWVVKETRQSSTTWSEAQPRLFEQRL
jgi:hypothetical protein